MDNYPTYVLITPARNEEAHIEKTIQSVIIQTILPLKWVIVSDASTDGTDEIVKKYLPDNPFIQLLRRDANEQRNFGSKVRAFNVGYEQLKGLDYDFIGNLDADVSFGNDYFENILNEFMLNEKLGIAGGIIIEIVNGLLKEVRSNSKSVAGAVQFFRIACFIKMGGYKPITAGLIDSVAEITARMNGWETKSFNKLKVLHHRSISSEGRNLLAIMFRKGELDYLLGVSPFFQLFKSLLIVFDNPPLLGTLLRIIKYWQCVLTEKKRPVSNEFVRFKRSEDRVSLLNIFR